MKQLMPESPSNVDSGSVSIPEDVNPPASSEPGDAPCTCLSHVRDIGDTVQDNNRGLMAKLTNAVFNYLSKNAD